MSRTSKNHATTSVKQNEQQLYNCTNNSKFIRGKYYILIRSVGVTDDSRRVRRLGWNAVESQLQAPKCWDYASLHPSLRGLFNTRCIDDGAFSGCYTLGCFPESRQCFGVSQANKPIVWSATESRFKCFKSTFRRPIASEMVSEKVASYKDTIHQAIKY